VISRIHRNAPNRVFVLSFGTRGVIADVITRAKFFVNRFRGFGVIAPRNFAISIELASRSYNSVGTSVLHCDTLFSRSLGDIAMTTNFEAKLATTPLSSHWRSETDCSIEIPI